MVRTDPEAFEVLDIHMHFLDGHKNDVLGTPPPAQKRLTQACIDIHETDNGFKIM